MKIERAYEVVINADGADAHEKMTIRVTGRVIDIDTRTDNVSIPTEYWTRLAEAVESMMDQYARDAAAELNRRLDNGS